jgi:NitT/TauT family transport system ATP-binding protein
MASVDISALQVTYRGVGQEVRALESVDLSVTDGEPIAVIGPSGCGKSTLLLAVAGLLEPTAGNVRVDGEIVGSTRLTTALILQDFGLLPWKTVFHNAALGLEIRGVSRAETRARATAALEQVGIADFARAYPGELSGGMRQRLALARALALDADLLLMDEPLSALDALTREVLQRLLLDLWRERGHTQIIVTHSIEEAVYLGRRIVVLSPRPATVARIVDNSRMGDEGYRDTDEYYAHCAELRALLREGGAFADAALPVGSSSAAGVGGAS